MTRVSLCAGLAMLVAIACVDETGLSSYRLAVAGGRTQVSDICIVNGKGKVVQQVTTTSDRAEMWPLWAADGRRVFYESRETADRTISLRVFDLDREQEEIVYGPVRPGELWCALSPDGTKLAYITKDSVPGLMVLKDLRSGAVTPLARQGERLVRPEWAPDSKRILCQSGLTGVAAWDLVVVDTDTGERRVLGGASDTTEFKGRWSPDGRFVVYSITGEQNRGNVGMVVQNLETGGRTIVSQGEEERVVSGAWSSLGVLAALRERPMPMSILLWPDASQPRDRREVPLDDGLRRGRLVWSPDGRYLALNARGVPRRGKGDWKMIVFDSEGNEICKWRTRTQMYCPAWAPLPAANVS